MRPEEAESTTAGLRSSTIWIYGSVGLPLAMIGYPIGVFLPDLYHREMGLGLPAIGLMLMLARLSDAFTDPAMGFMSDNVETRFGRRKPWLAMGVPVMLLGIWMLFTPQPGISQWYLLIWYAFMTLGSTMIGLPYSAWGAELSTEYHTRTQIQSAREIFVLIGLMAAAMVPFIVQQVFPGGIQSGLVLLYLAYVLLLILPAVSALVLWRVPEPTLVQTRRRVALWGSLQLISKNGLFRILIGIEFLVTGGESFRNALSLFFMRDAIGIQAVGQLYVLYFATGLAAIPFWTWLAKRFGKHISLAGAMVLVSIVSIWIFLLDYGSTTPFYWLFAAKGFCFCAVEYLPRAMLADIVDVDTARSGDPRPGSYFAVHGIITKFANASGTGASLILLGWVGYVATRGSAAERAINGPSEILWLAILYAIVPTMFFAAAFFLAWTYPLTQARHRRLEAAINRRRERLARRSA